MLSPAVARDLLGEGSGEALELFSRRSPVAPAALNLCGSLAGAAGPGNESMGRLIRRLLAEPLRLR